jgi:hypothetical protein
MARPLDEIVRDLRFYEDRVRHLRGELREALDKRVDEGDPAALAARTMAEAIRDGLSVDSQTRQLFVTREV